MFTTAGLDKKRCPRSHWKNRCKSIPSLPRRCYFRHPLQDHPVATYDFLEHSGACSSVFSGVTGLQRVPSEPGICLDSLKQISPYSLRSFHQGTAPTRVVSANGLWTLTKRNSSSHKSSSPYGNISVRSHTKEKQQNARTLALAPFFLQEVFSYNSVYSKNSA